MKQYKDVTKPAITNSGRSTQMKTQDTGAAGQQVTPPSPARPKRNRWLAGSGAIIAVMLIVGLSALVCAQLTQHQACRTTPTPPIAQWKQVLTGYTLTSLIAARSNPAVLYACAIHKTPNTPSQSNQGVVTVLRSTDFGDHWQDISSKASLGNTCQLAVNPANSNELYAVSNISSSQQPGLLKHSTDGGQTWETIRPLLHPPNGLEPVTWSVQQIYIDENPPSGMICILPLPVHIRAAAATPPKLRQSVVRPPD